MRRSVLVFVLAVLAVLAVLGCGGSPSRGARPLAAPGHRAMALAPAGAPVEDAVQVAVGSGIEMYSGCAVRADARLYCWGGPNVVHAVGRRHGQSMPGPTLVATPAGVIEVRFGSSQLCVRLEDGSVWCAAPNRGLVDTGVRAAVQISVGVSAACARLADGRVLCWGHNGGYALGVHTPTQSSELGPTEVPGIHDAVDVFAGVQAACAVRAGGQLVCWGVHPFRANAATETEDELWTQARPLEVAGAPRLRRIVLAAEGIACAIGGDQRLLCARRASPRAAPAFVAVEPQDALRAPVALDAAMGTACIAARDGRVWCWGPGPGPRVLDDAWNAHVAASYGDATSIAGLTDAVEVSVFGTHACARTRDRRVHCWGTNGLGELGDGTALDSATPTTLVHFAPDALPQPPGGVGGCAATVDVRRACARSGDDCALEAEPGYWSAGPGGGAECDEQCQQRIMAVLAARAVPPCMCTCTPEYRDAYQRWLETTRGEPPP